jgi:N-acetylglucosamine-6-phosphate deacetylase
MMKTETLNVESLFDGELIRTRQSIEIKNGRILSINNCSSQIKCLPGLLVPGFIDIQVNGGGNYLFNESPTLKAIENIAKAHQKFGTTSWFPTLVTDSFDKMSQAANAVSEALNDDLLGVLGIHFEGPCLSTEKKGVHSKEFIRKISKVEMGLFKRKDIGKVIVTVAPENISTKQITDLVNNGVIVCLGHSNATFEQTNLALKAGATGFTHLFNAMSPLTSREPGVVGAALLDENSYASLILDNIHVHIDTVKLAMKCKQNIMLVTDAMPPVGTEQESFEFFGATITRDGYKLTDQSGRLAGSAIDMLKSVMNAVDLLGCSFTRSINLATLKPASFLGLQSRYGRISVGANANLLLIENECEIKSSWINGFKIN